jgi:hypothetical protein
MERADPTRAVIDALKLAEAFDTRLASPSVAAAIRRMLRHHPVACGIIRDRVLRPKGIDAVRSFAIGEGRTVAIRAPSFGKDESSSGVPLRAFLDPIRRSPIRRAFGKP